MLMHDVARETQPGAPIAVLSGPTFAHEVAAGMPTAVTLRGRGSVGRRGSGRAARSALVPALSFGRRRRRRDRRRGQERARHRLRRGRGAAARPECARGPDLARLRRNDAVRARQGRARRDARRPVGPRRSRPDLLVDQLAQFQPRQGARRGPRRRRSARRPPHRRGRRLTPRRCSGAPPRRSGSTCRSSPRSALCSAARRRWTRWSNGCSRGRSGSKGSEPQKSQARPLFSQSP